jgi:hypothetical protein
MSLSTPIICIKLGYLVIVGLVILVIVGLVIVEVLIFWLLGEYGDRIRH